MTLLSLVDKRDSAVSQAPFAALLFRPDEKLTLVWRNDAHGTMTETVGLDVANQGMFEAFPPSDDEEGAAAMSAIRKAVAEMMDTKQHVNIGPYRYDLRTKDGHFVEHHWRIRMSPVISEGQIVAFLQVAEDATREVLQKRLTESLRRAASSTAGVSFFSYDPETDHFVRTAAVDEMFGFSPGEAGEFAAAFFDRVHPDDIQGVRDEVERVFAAPRGEIAAFDYRVPHADGSERFLRIRAEIASDPADRREKLVGTFVDLTDVELDRRQLQKELSLREALVREASHRIKNSLAIALAMLRMERQSVGRKGGDDVQSALSSLGSLEARISAISGAHGLMELKGDRTEVSMHALLTELVGQMRATAGLSESDLQLKLAGSDAGLQSDVATSLGMILSELVTNALKYGLNKSGRAEIKVSAERSGKGYRIVVKNRIEQDQPIDPISSSKLGSMLVQQLAADFNSSVDARVDGQYYLVCIHLPD